MRTSNAWLRRAIACATCAGVLLSGQPARSETIVPPELRQFADKGILLGIDTTQAQPRLVVGDRYKSIPRGLQMRAKALARMHARATRPDAATLEVVDTTGRQIETVTVRP